MIFLALELPTKYHISGYDNSRYTNKSHFGQKVLEETLREVFGAGHVEMSSIEHHGKFILHPCEVAAPFACAL